MAAVACRCGTPSGIRICNMVFAVACLAIVSRAQPAFNLGPYLESFGQQLLSGLNVTLKDLIDQNAAHTSADCNCQPCGCQPQGSCAGAPGCAPFLSSGPFYGGDLPPSQRVITPRFNGKTVLITGGTSGNGFGMAKAYVQECATVYVIGRNGAKGLKAQTALRALQPTNCAIMPGLATFSQLDIRNRTAIKALVETIGDFQVAIHNAGTGGYGVRRFVDIDDAFTDPSFWNDAISINFRGTMNTMQAVLRHWEAVCLAGGRCTGYSMVNTVSTTALNVATTQNSIYSAIKAGILNLCHSVATEYKPPITSVYGGDGKLDVRINCISPGAVNTALLRNTGKSFIGLYPWQCYSRDASGNIILKPGAADGPGVCPDMSISDFASIATYIGTALQRDTRVGEAEEIAQPVLFLTSDAASYIRGSNIVIDDGAWSQGLSGIFSANAPQPGVPPPSSTAPGANVTPPPTTVAPSTSEGSTNGIQRFASAIDATKARLYKSITEGIDNVVG